MSSVDYYELLDLPNNEVSGSDIKLAFRKKALQLHPDKNRDIDPEKATAIFQEVQHAYEVLSDTNERAWYDAHKDEILRGVDPDASDGPQTARATSVDVYRMFSTAAYTGFGAEQDGFFGVYREAFRKLAVEENNAGSSVDFPGFGFPESSWATPKAFYNEWDSFVTARSFLFADKWNLADAPDRQVRRLMERENRRERTNARKDFISLIRNLVAFVKKRDPRVAARKKFEQEESARADKLRKIQEEREKQERILEREKLKSGQEEYMKDEMGHLDELIEEMGLNDDSAAEEEIEFYCPVCRRKFRSQAQWDNHEKSKKHLERVVAFRATLAKEDTMELDDDRGLADNELQSDRICSGRVEHDEPSAATDSEQSEDVAEHVADESLDDPEISENPPVVEEYISRSKKKQMKKTSKQGARSQSTDPSANKLTVDQLSEAPVSGRQGTARNRRRKKKNQAGAEQVPLACATCGAGFESRNRLFDHIKQEGHASLK